ncbi:MULTISPECIES: hypothetical protein [Streptomyces]|uniref:Flp pilus assembly protein TadD n=1 Tax=Streptomyces clavifer TaxID=68188 RepID=A0ABS4VFI5_9ACTN|nr:MULTISPECIES: hypothetical protein [Streptomyces]KQX94440.1 hypothetical protein ASD26_18340 [Streptomyces sp. Root1319]KQZ05598.1 hypothetical protein ASD51_14550 [Streptomyces sp. Root55]MBP2362675.1 Flp pilus assembly protein TadD [Streptomyces clavifer]MDX2742655.1 hypothetical protein [Streptomyces sp. NRRL_B-2557]MDX3061077.1 hypothetical protein [Streptomyces sp. ND04-05B]
MEQQEASKDAVVTRIGQAVMLLHGGDREEARNRFRAIWVEIGEDGDALHRCTLAHYMADTQDDPGDELAWDLRALTAAEGLTGAAAAEHRDALAVRSFFPSLHLNLAADYLKLERFEAARVHLDHAWDSVGVLADDGYGGGIRAAIGRLEQRMRRSGAGE